MRRREAEAGLAAAFARRGRDGAGLVVSAAETSRERRPHDAVAAMCCAEAAARWQTMSAAAWTAQSRPEDGCAATGERRSCSWLFFFVSIHIAECGCPLQATQIRGWPAALRCTQEADGQLAS
ncbi:unnamed protein product [Urochloa humidicola]